MLDSVLLPKEQTCCFSGHRTLPKDKLAHIAKRIDKEIEKLLSQGITVFMVGGALGFDYLAAVAVSRKSEVNNNIKLVFALPYPSYNAGWAKSERLLYNKLIPAEADEVIYVSDSYSKDCYKKRNQFMVQKSQYCICALLHSGTGTGQTVRMAKADGLAIINLLQDSGSNDSG